MKRCPECGTPLDEIPFVTCLTHLVEAFEVAVRDQEMIGSKDPRDRYEIEEAYRLAKDNLVKVLTKRVKP